MMNVVISKSDKKDKKLKAVIDKGTGKSKTVHFGSSGFEDYTIHKDDKRKERYIDRHRKNENWTSSGVDTAGFWSKNLLWNKKTIKSSIDGSSINGMRYRWLKHKFEIKRRAHIKHYRLINEGFISHIYCISFFTKVVYTITRMIFNNI